MGRKNWLLTSADARGVKNNNALLNPDKVRKIRRLAEKGTPQIKIARRFLIGPSTVSCIVQRTRWGHVE